MADDNYTIGELARMVAGALARMESLAARLEGGQFVSAEVFRVYKEKVDLQLQGLTDEVDDLKDDKKWLTRLVYGFIILAVLGVVLSTGGIGK